MDDATQTHGLDDVGALVMLHGCTQSAEALASSICMNQIAAKEGFVVLYPEQGIRQESCRG